MVKKKNVPKPLRGISIISEWDDLKSYRLNCDCTDLDHTIDAWIQIDKDDKDNYVELIFNTDAYFSKSNFLQRLKAAIHIIFNGNIKYYSSHVLKPEVIDNFCLIIQKDHEELKKLIGDTNERNSD